jgi:hypothetical protein
MKQPQAIDLPDFAVINLKRDRQVNKGNFSFDILEDHILITKHESEGSIKTKEIHKPLKGGDDNLFFSYKEGIKGLEFPIASQRNCNLYSRQSFLHHLGFIDNDKNRRYLKLNDAIAAVEEKKRDGYQILVIESPSNSAKLYYIRDKETWLYKPFIYYCVSHFDFSETLTAVKQINNLNSISQLENDFDNGTKLKPIKKETLHMLFHNLRESFLMKIEKDESLIVLLIKQREHKKYLPLYVAHNYGNSISKQDMEHLADKYH